LALVSGKRAPGGEGLRGGRGCQLATSLQVVEDETLATAFAGIEVCFHAMQPNTAANNILRPARRPAAAPGQNSDEVSRGTVIAFKAGTGEGREPMVALTASESGELADCEGILERGLCTFFEVGNALLTIRENRLYRDKYSTFKQYCKNRWNIGRSYACRVMGAAERLRLLPSEETVPRPANEFQMRPFLKLAPEEFPGAWKRAVKTAKEGKITSSVVQAVIRELLPNNEGQAQAGKKGKRSKSKARWPGGQVLLLLNETKRQVKKGETEKALAGLEQIEDMLFGLRHPTS